MSGSTSKSSDSPIILPRGQKTGVSGQNTSGSRLTLEEIALREGSPSTDTPLWNPRGERPNDGISFSLLSRFLECRRRFGLQVFAGVKDREEYSVPLEFGNLWHLAEEYAMKPADWRTPTKRYYRELMKLWPSDIPKVNETMYAFATQFPIYLDHFKEIHDDLDRRVPILEEYPFNERFDVWGDFVRLRGKLDLVYALKTKNGHVVYIQENKTKGDIDQLAIPATLFANLQTMIYTNAVLILLRDHPELFPENSTFGGVVFNVIRRPGSGKPPTGPRRKAGQSNEEYWSLMEADIRKRPKFYFLRWKTPLTSDDISWFNDNTLYPILYQLLAWFDWRTQSRKFTEAEGRIAASLDYQYPWGMWSGLAQGFRGSYFDFLAKNDPNKLVRVSNLFPELQPESV